MKGSPRHTACAAALFFAAAPAAAPLAAQQTFVLDAGASRMTFADSLGATALSLSPAFTATGSRGSFNALGTLSRLAQSWSNSATVSTTLESARRGALEGELEGILGGSAHSDGGKTGQLLGNGRLYLLGDGRGAWAGVGIGRTWDGAWHAIRQGELGAWLTSGANTVSAQLTPAQVADTIRYTDALLTVQRQVDRWELGASVGLRAGARMPSLPANSSAWGSVGAVYWATPTVGVVAGAGTYPVDFTQGYPGGNYVSLALRLRARATPGASAASVASTPSGPGLGALEVRDAGGDSRTLRVYAPAARRVEISGDFTGWDSLSLQPVGKGWWTGSAAIPAGTHEVNVRIDGGEWLVPPGLTPLKDEFGGSVGLLTVR